jgi:hypothetical protein
MLAFGCVYLLFKKTKSSGKIISSVLSFFWLWIGVVYHFLFFTSINKAAYLFGTLFILQGLLFFLCGVLNSKISFEYRKNKFNFTGIILIVYALIIYPLLGYLFGHRYPGSPTFGLPCPTTIFTFGVLLFVDKKISVFVLIIPFLWSLMGFSAAVNLSIYEDFGLLIAGVASFVLLIVTNRKNSAKAKMG